MSYNNYNYSDNLAIPDNDYEYIQNNQGKKKVSDKEEKKIDEKQLVIGNNLDIYFELESREFNGKWYTDVKAWKINLTEKTSDQKPTEKPVDFHFLAEEISHEDDDGLPF